MKVSEQRFIELSLDQGLRLAGGTRTGGVWVTTFYNEYLEKGLASSHLTKESHPHWYAFVESLQREEKLLMIEAAMEVIGED